MQGVSAERSFRTVGSANKLYLVDPSTLYKEHHEPLVRYLTHLTGDPDRAADAAQEAFARLLTQPPSHDDNLRAWLYTVATNVIRDGWKKQQTALRLVQESNRLPQTAQPDPHSLVERKERQEYVKRILARLSLRDRTVLLMREEGFAHREIAEAVGTTTKSVGTLIARALRKFAAELESDRGRR